LKVVSGRKHDNKTIGLIDVRFFANLQFLIKSFVFRSSSNKQE